MLDPKEEQKYEQLKELGQELHIPIFEAFLELEVRDGEGKIIQQHKQRSHSWVRNAFNLLLSQMASKDMEHGTFGPGLLSIRDISGIVRGSEGVRVSASTLHETFAGGYRANVAVTMNGILVGSGVAAESFEDFILQTPIAEGVGVGQLNHVAMPALTRTYDSTLRRWDVSWMRFMNNNSGAGIPVNEVGLFTAGSAAGISLPFLMARDLLPATVVVPNTGQLRVTYVISLTYPA